jgi:hypothetical protein
MFVPFLLVFLFAYTVVGEVNEFSGDMVMNHNLFRVSGKNIFLDINLTYQSGIKINQRANWVGLGFDISLPYVERIPVGSADEKTGGNPDCLGSTIDRYSSIKNYGKLLLSEGNGYSETPAEADNTGQQDEFILNAPFASGSIVFGQPSGPSEPMQPYLQNWRAVKVDYTIVTNAETGDANITKWTFIDENGTIYLFEQAVRIGTVNGAKRAMSTHNILGRNGQWVPDGESGQVIYGDGFANDFYNSRWYLTEIRSPDDDYVKVDYTSEQSPVPFFDATCFQGVDNGFAATASSILSGMIPMLSLFRYIESSANYSVVSYAAPENVRSLYPVYPVRIYSRFEKAEFQRSATDDYVLQGKERINEIHLYSGSTLQKKIRFNYDATGLALNHPYAGVGEGLLKLNSISTVSSSGIALPTMSFEYASNPNIEYSTSGDLTNYTGMLYHDFFGYRSSTSIMNLHPFSYPEGQSTLGDAKAWSVNRITYGNGKIDEYEYDLNVINAISTNEDIDAGGKVLNAGIRVTRRKEYSGIGTEAVITDYTYGKGFAPHNYAIDESVQDFYSWLNTPGYITALRNVLALDGVTAQYSYCKKQTSGSGSVITYFLNSASEVDNYGTTGTSLLKDYRNGVNGINSRAPFRGAVAKVERFTQADETTPISSAIYCYKLKLDFKQYVTPEVASVPMTSCLTGGGDPENPAKDPNNLNQTDYIGYLRLMKIEEKKDGVINNTENVVYNETNGFPSITRVKNSDGKQKLTQTTFAFEKSVYSSGMGPSGANMLTQSCQTIVYEKASGDNSTNPLSTEIRSAQATTWSPSLGCAAWLPYKSFSWKANFQADGTPDQTFADYDFSAGAENPNWQYAGAITKYGEYGNVLESINPRLKYRHTLYTPDGQRPIANATNARYGDCLFTDFERNDLLEGIGSEMTTVSAEVHFSTRGAKVTSGEPNADRYGRSKPSPDNSETAALGGRAYIMDFWAKSDQTSTTSFVHLQAKDSYAWSSAPIINLSNKWQRYSVKVTFPAGVSDKRFYAIMRPPASGPGAFLTGTVYYSDVRVYPVGSLMTHSYYDSKWQQPVLLVDENNNAGQKIVYDGFGRPIEWWKLDKENPVNKTLVQSKEYHLMGE